MRPDIDMFLLPIFNPNIIPEAVLLLLLLLLRVLVSHKFCVPLALPISPDIRDGFWCSRCLKDRIKVPDTMKFFVGSATTPLVVKIWTKQPKVEIIPLPLIKSSPVDGFWRLRCLYDRIDQPNMIGSFASGANVSLVAKIGTKDLAISCSVNRI